MITKVKEYSHGLSIEIVPETPEEVAQLFRFTKNVRAYKPSVSMFFDSAPACSIFIKKISKEKQVNHISNR